MSEQETTEATAKWQPMMLVLDRRLECTTCGSLAVFLTGKISESEKNILEKADAWCFECYRKNQEAEE